MTPEKDAELCSKYPKIFRDRNASPQETCMCWGLDVGDGWYDLIDALCSSIQNQVDNILRRQAFDLKSGRISAEDVVPDEDIQVVAAQVKEKFGGLRFYVNGCDDAVRGMIDMAEAMSFRICESCGGPGKPDGDGWISTLCDPCREKRERRRIERMASPEKLP